MQRWTWPPSERHGRRESQCRVWNASLAARLAVMYTDGTAQRHNLAGSQGSQGDGN
ncbi:hypothetical protein F9U42_11625 [Pectobacterium versatile]|uniref:hypothetical protein n=1 Tax=Pectobacterium versatile TaxID=2488639 RepID=UPI001B384327|nr:hypothetical protein [Pectobacterium versatile]MBQ4767781.1 hypothetical protein [Pectobacterium versatile]